MSFHRTRVVILLILVVLITLNMGEFADATSRVLSEKKAGGDYLLESYTTGYELTRLRMGSWLQRLSSGPSPRGPGH